MNNILLLLAAALAARPCTAYWVPAPPPPDALVKEFDAGNVRRVEVRAGAGAVRVEPVMGASASAIALRKDFGPDCKVEMTLREGRLTLAASEKTPDPFRGGGNLCAVDFTLRLPRPFEFYVETGSGSIEGEGLKGPARLRTGSGGVRLSWESAPPKGSVEVDSGSGRVELAFPSGTRADASLISGSGAVQNGLAIDRRARLRVRVRSGSGDIVVR